MNKLVNRKKKKGFTLIELIVVIAILGILAAIGTPIILGQITKANAAADLSNASALYNAAQVYVVNQDTAGASVLPATGTASADATQLAAIRTLMSSSIGTAAVCTVTFNPAGVASVTFDADGTGSRTTVTFPSA